MSRPPDTAERRPVQTDGAPEIQPDTTIPDPSVIAAFIELSDERDLQLELRLQAWRESRLVRCDACYEAGYARAVEDWKVVIGLVDGGQEFADLDRRRYPPGGRLSWIIPRTPGDDAA